jgi:hypothetical protein
MNNNIARRLAQLEKAACPVERLPTWVRIIVERGDTEEAAKARYAAEHLEMPTPTHWIVIRIVSPDDPELN